MVKFQAIKNLFQSNNLYLGKIYSVPLHRVRIFLVPRPGICYCFSIAVEVFFFKINTLSFLLSNYLFCFNLSILCIMAESTNLVNMASSPKALDTGEVPIFTTVGCSDSDPVNYASELSHEETMRLVRSLKGEVNILKEERRCLARELNTKVENEARVRKSLVVYLGLLSQFSEGSVRIQFLNGELISSCYSSSILASIDSFRSVLLPSPDCAFVDEDSRMNFIGRLFSKDMSEPMDLQGKPFHFRRPFSWWRDLFERLVTSSSWKTSDRYNEDRNHLHMGSAPSLVNSSFGEKSVKPKNPKLLSSSPSSSDEDRKPFKLDPESFERRKKNRKRSASDEDSVLLKALQNLGRKKEVIPPAVFNSDKADKANSFERFLSSYERYFHAKYDGTQREMSTHLERFLEGTVRAAYGAIGGSGMKYDKLKTKLLLWFQAQTIDRNDKVREKFSQLSMKSGETCAIYCLRVEQMALKAFKDSPREMEHQLKRKLRDTAPSSLIQQIDTAESIFSIAGEEGLTWKRIKKIAEQHDRKKMKGELTNKMEDERVALFYNNPDTARRIENPRKPWESDHLSSPPRQQRVHWSEKRLSPPSGNCGEAGQYSGRNQQRRGPIRDMRCRQCGKNGHTERNCWGKQNRCFACGSREHWKLNCPLVTKRYGRTGEQRYGPSEDNLVNDPEASDGTKNLN